LGLFYIWGWVFGAVIRISRISPVPSVAQTPETWTDGSYSESELYDKSRVQNPSVPGRLQSIPVVE